MNKTGIELIAEERREQIEKHGFTVESDVKGNWDRQLPYASKQLLDPIMPFKIKTPNGWYFKFWARIVKKTYKERLIIAGALIAAEIDRIQSLELKDNEPENN